MRSLYVLAAVACLATAPALAQQPAAGATQAPAAAAQPAPTSPRGPRLNPGFASYRPALAHDEATTAAAADRTIITISTLGLVLLAVLLIVLLS